VASFPSDSFEALSGKRIFFSPTNADPLPFSTGLAFSSTSTDSDKDQAFTLFFPCFPFPSSVVVSRRLSSPFFEEPGVSCSLFFPGELLSSFAVGTSFFCPDRFPRRPQTLDKWGIPRHRVEPSFPGSIDKFLNRFPTCIYAPSHASPERRDARELFPVWHKGSFFRYQSPPPFFPRARPFALPSQG